MTLPSKIDIQIINPGGAPNPLANVLFGLKIFISDNSWHNYSVFKSDVNGHITLTSQDIIENTELKWKTNILSGTPTKFELYVWQGKNTDDMIKMTKHLVELYNDEEFIKQDLKKHGVADENISKALEATKNKAIDDNTFYKFIKDAVNNRVKITTPKIEGIWSDNFEKSYKFVIQAFAP
jgi:hypothetical protein